MSLQDFLLEDIVATKRKDFKLKKSSLNDTHIQDTIKIYAKAKGIDVQLAADLFENKIEENIRNHGSLASSTNMIDNAAESVAFKFISELDPKDIDLSIYGISGPGDLLDRDYFFDLTEYVLGENAQFFPLKNPFEPKAVRPYFFITPDHLPLMKRPGLAEAAEHHCKTAFCTPHAEMVFDRKFCEQLAVAALINKIKPASKKYKSNGGPIPDHYCYLEFVIMHELLHYSAGDHFYTDKMVKVIQKKYPKSAGKAHTILNFVGDFINNWQLAKSGYEQIPLGLFSEKINYDVFETYEEVIEAVVNDLATLNKQQYENAKDTYEEGMDDHQDRPDEPPSPGGSESNNSDTSDDQQDQGSDGQANAQQDQQTRKIYKVGDEVVIDKTGKRAKVVWVSAPDNDGKQSVKVRELDEVNESFRSIVNETTITLTNDDISPHSSDDSDGEPDGEPAGEPAGEDIANAIDEQMKKNQENIDTRDDGNNDAKSALDTPDKDDSEVDIENKVKDASSAIEFKKTNTVISWKKILKKMIPTGVGDPEDTYAKMSRQATSSMITAQQTGTGRISPGEVIIDSNKKGLVFVIDNSASVLRVVNQFNQEIVNLLKKNKKELENMFIIKFSNDFEVNKIDVSKLTYKKIKNPKKLVEGKGKIQFGPERSIKELFSETYGLGTTYTVEMHKVIEFLHKSDMNVILFTDADLIHDKNAGRFFKLGVKKRNSIAAFITDDTSHKLMTNKFGKYKWMTVLK